MLAVEGERLGGEQPSEDDCRLLQALDPNRSRIELHARVLVLLAEPTGTEAHLQPALRQHVERRELLGQHRRLPEVLGQHGLGDAQRGRRVGDGLPAISGANGRTK